MNADRLWQTLRGFWATRRRLWIVGVGLLVTGLIGLVAYLRWESSDPGLPSVAPVVELHTVSREELRRVFEGPGTVTYLEKAAITPRIQGRIAHILVEVGDDVIAGQPLARLETFELELRHRQALAALNSARSQHALAVARLRSARFQVDRQLQELERTQASIVESRAAFLNARRELENKREIYALGGVSAIELRGVYAGYLSAMSRYYQARKNYQTATVGFRDQDLSGSGIAVPDSVSERRSAIVEMNTAVSSEEVQVAAAALESARIEVRSLEALIEEATIRSPIAGVVASRELEMGETTTEGQTVFTVVRMDRLVVSTAVPEEDLGSIAVDQAVDLSFDARSGEQRQGTVERLSPLIDPATRTAEVRIALPNQDRAIRPGMFARVSITTAVRDSALWVPRSALLPATSEDGEVQVFVVQEGLAFLRTIEPGSIFQERVEVLSGLSVGEQVIAGGVLTIQDGMTVQTQSAGDSEGTP